MTRQNMTVGGTWLQSHCVSCSNNVSIAVSPMKTRSSVQLRPGNTSATLRRPPSIGAFQSLRHARNWNDSLHHFQRDGVLDVHFVSSVPVERHARAGGHPVPGVVVPWIPAFAGMTQSHRHWQCIYETDI